MSVNEHRKTVGFEVSTHVQQHWHAQNGYIQIEKGMDRVKKKCLSLVLVITLLAGSVFVAEPSGASAAETVPGETVPSQVLSASGPAVAVPPGDINATPEPEAPTEDFHGASVPTPAPVISDAEWKKNVTGSAGVLEGKSVLVSIFVNDKNSKWTNRAKKEAMKKVSVASTYIKKQAKTYGKDVELLYDTNKYKDLCYNYSTKLKIRDTGKSQMALYKKMKKFIRNKIDVTALRQKYGTDSIGFLVHVNKTGTSSTLVHYVEDGSKYFYECSTLFTRYDGKPEGAATYAHEILHLFGARDLYEESWADMISPSFVYHIEKKFPNEIMYSTYTMDGRQLKYKITNRISRITAYFLGWRKNIPEKKKYRLQDMKQKGCFCSEW